MDAAAFRRCLTRAAVDLTARTLAVSENTPSDAEKGPKDNVTDALVKAFWKAKIYEKFDQWFAPIADPALPMLDFDTWHHEACDLVLGEIQKRYPGARYGKAQKVINMTFKTMYALVAAFPPAFDVERYFYPCHIPLDSFTLDWFKSRKYPARSDRKSVLQPNPDRKVSCKSSKIAVGYYADAQTEWSNIRWNGKSHYIHDGRKTVYTYQFYVDEIRNLFRSDPDSPYGCAEPQYAELTPLQAEFLIWEKMQHIRSVKSLAVAMERFCAEQKRIRQIAAEHAENNPEMQEHIDRILKACRALAEGDPHQDSAAPAANPVTAGNTLCENITDNHGSF